MGLGMRAFLTLEMRLVCYAQALGLSQNQIGDVGMSALADAFAKGSMASLESLNLRENKIGDLGMSSLSEALAKGSLASLQTLFVDDGPLGTEHPALKEACKARGISLC